MSEHEIRVVQRNCDVAVVGGSAAGLAAALQLGRQRRSVIVVDAGEPRNAPAAHLHSYLGREGMAPADFLATAREEVRSYGVEVLPGRAIRVSSSDDGRFHVELTGGHSITARRVLAATGLLDELPAFDGLAQHWGRDVIHCPFCHGFEVRDRRIVQILTHPGGLHAAALFRQLTDRLTVVVSGGAGVDRAELDTLRRGGVSVIVATVSRVLTGADGRVSGVELAGVELGDNERGDNERGDNERGDNERGDNERGDNERGDNERIDADVIAVGPRFTAQIAPFAALGLRLQAHPSGLGDVVQTDAMGATAVPGVYAAGNVTDPGQQVLSAAANGSMVGAMISASLAHEDLQSEARPSGHQADWDQRYSGEQMWSGNPNATLVDQVDDLVPGRALDVGAGEGGDALWLSGQGWQVSASDISQRALDRVEREARRRDLKVRYLRVDANALNAFGPAAFDLVTAHYASIPRTPDGRGLRNLLNAVAPGGTLLYVGHDLEPMRAPIDTLVETRPFDPDAYLRVKDVHAALVDSPLWEIETFQTRPRPSGAAHHAHDVILRARRTTAQPEG